MKSKDSILISFSIKISARSSPTFLKRNELRHIRVHAEGRC
ncbi:MAG TPA: hypothetical protein VIK72_18825 [Clostridiaceae bacterium]